MNQLVEPMNHKPKLYGLVLVGGRSTRMGSEKHLLKYHRDSQQKRTYDLLREVCDSTFLSIRQDQVPSCEKDFKVIVRVFAAVVKKSFYKSVI